MSTMIDYLSSLTDSEGHPILSMRSFQLIVPNFPPLQTLNFQIAPVLPVYAFIVYETSFGQAMVPHSFNVKMDQAGTTIFDAIVSGRFTERPANHFAIATAKEPLTMAVTNRRLLTNYYESTTFHLRVADKDQLGVVIDAIRRVGTSIKLENMISNIGQGLPASSPREPIV